jgi:hypothetical protein
MKLSLSSLKNLLSVFVDTFSRFSFALTSAYVIGGIGIYLLHNNYENWLYNILFTLVLGVFLFISTVLISENYIVFSKNFFLKKYGKAVLHIFVIGFLVGYYFLLPDNFFQAEGMHMIRYILWSIAFFLLITFIPFLGNDEKENFWNYNKTLIAIILQTILFSVIIFAGLSFALGAIDFLFEIEIDGNRYAEIWIVIISTFSPTFALAHFHRLEKILERKHTYPILIKILSQYVLIPLVTLYFFILYMYLGKILITGDWPKGMVSFMIVGFSFVGIVSYCFLFILREKNKWIKIFEKMFFIGLIPLVCMLFWSVWIRIQDYGMTENRYFLMLFGMWLFGIAVYFLFSSRKSLKIMFVSLFFLTFFSSFGQWSAFSISQYSQTHRILNIFTRNNMLDEGKVHLQKDIEEVSKEYNTLHYTSKIIEDEQQKKENLMSFEDEKEISAVIDYLYSIHGIESIQKIVHEDITLSEEKYDNKRNFYNMSAIITKALGVDYVERWTINPLDYEDITNIYFSSERNGILGVQGYDYMIPFFTYFFDEIDKNNETFLYIDGKSFKFFFDKQNFSLKIFHDELLLEHIFLQSFFENLYEQYKDKNKNEIPQNVMSFLHISDTIDIKIYFESINIDIENTVLVEISSLEGKMLVRFH